MINPIANSFTGMSSSGVEKLTLDECQKKLVETDRRIKLIKRLFVPFEAELSQDLQDYLDIHGDNIDFSSLMHSSRLRVQKYLFLNRSLVLLDEMGAALENRIKNIQKIFKESVEKIDVEDSKKR